ncbi:MAG TPA: rod shape-determining protein MreD [Pseudomonadales bacterium]
MVAPRPHGTWFIALTILIAGMLGVMPLPEWLEVWRPEWIALVLVYWVIALPHRVGLFTAWFVGLFIDVLEGSLLGLNAIVLTLIAYVALSLYQRLRMFTPLQQSTTILMLIGVTQLLIFWVLTATGQNTPQNLIFVVSALSSALVWPLIFVLLRFGRRALKVT